MNVIFGVKQDVVKGPLKVFIGSRAHSFCYACLRNRSVVLSFFKAKHSVCFRWYRNRCNSTKIMTKFVYQVCVGLLMNQTTWFMVTLLSSLTVRACLNFANKIREVLSVVILHGLRKVKL